MQALLLLFCLARPSTDQTRPNSLQQLGNFHHPPVSPHLSVSRHWLQQLFSGSKGTARSDNYKGPRPEYKPLAQAVDFFDNVHFYIDEDRVEICRRQRESTLGNMTLQEVYRQFALDHVGGVERGLVSLANVIGALEAPVLNVFAAVNMSLEDQLDAKQMMAIAGDEDLALFKTRLVQTLPTPEGNWRRTINTKNSENKKKRALSLALVLGSSGSGKTFFSFQYLAPEFLRKRQTKKVAFHLYPSRTGIRFIKNKKLRPEAAADLCNWIKQTASKSLVGEIKERLNMHLCIILDEAGDLSVRSWFESKAMLTELCDEAANLAKSVAVVVTGTALTGRELNSKNDAYIFRMKSWRADDLVRIIDGMSIRLPLVEPETTNSLAHVVFAHSKLGALATNARCAYFLSEALADVSCQYENVVWSLQLDSWAPSLVTSVVDEYIGSNGLNELKPRQRRRVAASVFRALRETKRDELILPAFVGLHQDKEIAVANSLVQYNVELGEDRLNFVSEEVFAITVTPAIALVLYTIAGVPTTLLSGWKAEEELAALYAIRQMILASMETYVTEIDCDASRLKKLNKTLKQVRSLARDRLDESLGKIQLLSLQKLKPKPDKSGKILIPMVGARTVLVNGEMAPFADVIAPYMLFQAKRITSESNKPVNLRTELGKCCLLKSQVKDTRLLQGLVELWRGNLAMNTYTTNKIYFQEIAIRERQCSDAFPANLLCLSPRDPFQYAVIEGNEIAIGEKRRHLAPLDGTTITFILSSNADKLRLRLSPKDVIKIDGRNLDENLEIQADSLSKSDKLAWRRFLKEVRKGTQIKFLLTKSV